MAQRRAGCDTVSHWQALQRSVAKPLHVQVAVSANNGALNSAVRGGPQHPTEANNAVIATVSIAVFLRRKTRLSDGA